MLLIHVMNKSSRSRTYATKMHSSKTKKSLKCGTATSFAALGTKPSFKAHCQSSFTDVQRISGPEYVSNETKLPVHDMRINAPNGSETAFSYGSIPEVANVTISKTQHYSAQLNNFLKRISEPITRFSSDLSVHSKNALKEDASGALVGLPNATTASELLRNIILRVCMGTCWVVGLVLGVVLCCFAVWVLVLFIQNFPWICVSMLVIFCLAMIGCMFI